MSLTEEHIVHDAVGPPLHPLETAACIAVGVNALLALGVTPALLGSLADEHRLSAAQIGLAAMLEALSMGVVTGLMGLIREPRALRWIGLAASLALAVADLAATRVSGVGLLAARGAAGAAEGVLLWITVSMIARTLTPERWAGVFFTTQVFAQLLLAVAFALWIIPRGGANGGLTALAICAVAGALPAFFLPRAFAPLNTRSEESGAPPLRGLLALAATFVFLTGGGAVAVYLQPLAHEAGLSSAVARTALWTSLVAQVAGGATAVLLAGRVRYFTVFVFTTTVYLVAWVVFGRSVPAWAFVAANVSAGFAALLLGPFLVPFTIDADPSRRAAMQSGAAQLLGGAAGPLLCSFVVSDADVRGSLWLGAGLVLTGLAMVAALRFTHKGARS